MLKARICKIFNKVSWFKNKKNMKKFLAILCATIFSYLFFAFVMNPVIFETIEVKSKALSTRAMNSAIADVIMGSIVYEDLVNIITDELGNISMIQANSLEINNLSKDLAQTTETRIEEYGRNGIKIPLGTFFGMPMFVGRGPQVRIKMNPVGSINCSFTSNFESAGINQTVHKIYLNITASVGVVLPLKSQKFTTSQQVLICESIIVGQVPEVYLYSDQLDTLLNFVPY